MEETDVIEKSESKANLGEDYWLQELVCIFYIESLIENNYCMQIKVCSE